MSTSKIQIRDVIPHVLPAASRSISTTGLAYLESLRIQGSFPAHRLRESDLLAPPVPAERRYMSSKRHFQQLCARLYYSVCCPLDQLAKHREDSEILPVTIFDPAFQQSALNLLVALLLGSLIGFERQWRQRMAGLRTNTLVSLGAAIFVVFASQFSDTSPTRVAAQVVSGIGFLGAGVIFKEGLNVRGLNTAATLWCSAAVGLLAGEGFALYALLAPVLVLGANTLLRPIVRTINRQPIDSTEEEHHYLISIDCRAARASETSA